MLCDHGNHGNHPIVTCSSDVFMCWISIRIPDRKPFPSVAGEGLVSHGQTVSSAFVIAQSPPMECQEHCSKAEAVEGAGHVRLLKDVCSELVEWCGPVDVLACIDLNVCHQDI